MERKGTSITHVEIRKKYFRIAHFITYLYAAVNVALDVLSKGITHKGIPDQHGVSGNVSYDITR